LETAKNSPGQGDRCGYLVLKLERPLRNW